MNANLNQTSYRMHEVTRNAAMTTVAQHRLAREAMGTTRFPASGLVERRGARMALAMLALFVVLAMAASSTHAQAMSDPGTTEPYHPALVSFRIGIYYQDSGRHEEAVAMFSEIVTAFPGFPEGWAARADSYHALGEDTLAIDDYTAAVALAPNLVSALTMRGDAYQQIGAFEMAVADYQNAIGQLPEYAAPHAGLSEAYAALGLSAEAVAEADAYRTLAGVDADPAFIAWAAGLQQIADAGAA